MVVNSLFDSIRVLHALMLFIYIFEYFFLRKKGNSPVIWRKRYTCSTNWLSFLH